MAQFPLGVYFPPSDRDLIEYLSRKNLGQELPSDFVEEVELYSKNPWEVVPPTSDELKWQVFDDLKPRVKTIFVFTKILKNEKGVGCKRQTPTGTWVSRTAKQILNQHGRVIGEKKYILFRLRNIDVNYIGSWSMHEIVRQPLGEDTYALCIITVDLNQTAEEKKK